MGQYFSWVITYNANLNKSSKYRKSKEELKRELKKWEEEKSKKKKTTVEDAVSHEVSFSSLYSLSLVWGSFLTKKQHKSEFARLVEVARPRKVESASADKGNGSLLSETSLLDGKQSTKTLGRLRAEEDAIVVDSEEEDMSQTLHILRP